MAGEDFFKFNKGNEFRFSNFREIKEEDLKGADEKTRKLFNIFAGEDKILQEVEAKSLFNVLKSAAGDNQVLEENEIKDFVKEHIGEEVDTNILATFVNNIFGVKEKPQNQAVQNVLANAPQKQQTFLEEAACKEIVIDIIDENLSEAYEILNSQYLGSISGWHDERKDKNDILKTSNVSKVLDYQNAGIEWMNKAKLAPPNGLTKKEYYEGNKQRIKDMILTRVLVLDTNTKFKELKNKYSEEKLAQIIGDYVEQLCSNASIEDLKDIQKQFVSYSGVEEIQALENVVDNAIKFNADKNKPVPYMERPLPKFDNSKGIVPEYWNTDEPISFEEVYKIERGTEYSQYKIEQYALAKKEMEVVANAYNKKQQFIEFAEGLRKDETLNIDEKTQKVLEGFATFYALAEDGGLSQLKELIAESKLPISIDENGFNFGTLDDNAKNRALNSLLKLAQQSKEKEFEEFLNGKTIEDYQIALAQAHDEAIGDENGKMMAEAMKNDNLTCIQRWTGNTSMAGMGMTIVGGILCFTPLAPLGAGMITVGNTLAIGGMVAKTGLGVTDYATKDVQTAEEAEQLTKDFIMDAGGFIIGMGAGKAGLKAFSKLIDKKLVAVFGQQIASGNKMQALKTVFTNPEYLKNFMTAAGAKLSADFVISYAGDLAMMGILDTQDDWQSLLKANLTGILVGMSGDIKDVSGVSRPRNFGVSDGVRPMTEMDYGQRLLGNDVTVADPKTGTTVEGTVTGLYSQNGQVEIEVNGQRYSTNDVAEVKGEAKVEVETPKVEILLGQRLETASSREEFVAIRDEIKAMPAGAEKTALQQEYLRKYNDFSRKYNEEFDIRMEYKPKNQTSVKLELKENEPVSVEKAKSMLSELGFPKDEIDALDFDNNSLINIIYIHFSLKDKLIPDFKDIDFSSNEAAEIRREFYGYLKEEPSSIAKFMNKENIDELKKYVDFDILQDIENIVGVLESDLFQEHYDEFMRIVPILTKNGTVKMTPEDFKELKWINESCLSLITPERVAFLDKINSKVPEEYKIHINSSEFLGEPEILTDNLVSEYVNEVNRFLNHNINDETRLWGSNLKNKIAQMKEISDFLDKYPVELGRNEKGLISSHEIESIMQRPDFEKIQKLLSEMTPEARKRVGLNLPEPNSDIPFECWRDFYNFISDDTFIENSRITPWDFIDFVKNYKIKDLDNFTKYIQELKNTYALSYTINLDRFFNVPNGDYKGASALLKEIKTLINDNNALDNYITYSWEYVLKNKDIDCQIALDNIKTLKEEGIEISFRPDINYIIHSKDPKNIVEKFKIMKQAGFEIEYCAQEKVFDNPNITPKQLEEIIDEFEENLSMKFGTSIDIDIVRHAALIENSGSIVCGLTSKDGLNEHLWGYILNNCKSVIKTDNKNFYDKLWNNPKCVFDKHSLLSIAKYINAENSDLAIKLCTDEKLNFPKNKIAEIVSQLNADNVKIIEKLCFDEKFKYPPDRILEIIKAISMINTDIKNLSLSAKINTFSTITSLSKDVLNLCRKYSKVDINAKMAELKLALGTKKDIITIPQEQQKLFVKGILANNNSNAEYVLKNFNFAQFGKEGLPLKYTREQFTANIKNLIKDLTSEEQIIVLEHFGLIEGAAGFDGMPTNKPFNNEDASTQLKETAQKIQSEIELFTTKNQICTGDATVDSVLNSLIQGLPEFTSIVGKKQHGTHAYSVDIHTLKVLQSAMNNPLYKNLTDRDKTILKIAALCHDFGKRGDVVDEGHASSSAEFCTAILDKFSFPQGMKDRIIDIVDNHHWFEAYNTGKATANDVAVRCRRPEDFLIYEILAKADFENVNEKFHLGEKSNGAKTQAEFDKFMQEKMQAIDDALTTMYSRSNLVFDTQFVQNGNMFPRQNVEINGELTELKVLNLNDLKDNESLQKYGFSTGVTKDNARFTVHMTAPRIKNLESVWILTQNSLNQSAWSTSLIKASNNRTYEYRKFGFIFDVDQANISEANYSNTGSGYGKGLGIFKDILFKADGSARTYVRDCFIEEMAKKGIKLNDKEYAQLVKFLITKKYTTQITKDIKIGEQVIKAEDLVKALERSRDALFEGGNIHSEIVPINPRVKGLVAKVEKLEDCPEEFLNFAKAHNLPIILMEPTD